MKSAECPIFADHRHLSRHLSMYLFSIPTYFTITGFPKKAFLRETTEMRQSSSLDGEPGVVWEHVLTSPPAKPPAADAMWSKREPHYAQGDADLDIGV